MITFNHHLRTALASAALGLVPCALSADVIELNQGDRLTGSISDLNNEGVTINSPLAVSPLQIKADTIKSLTFDTEKEASQQHHELLTLASGDTLPCHVEALDMDELKITTWYAGSFTIKRKYLESLQFGITENKVIYRGTDLPSQWETNEGRWKYNDNSYRCEGVGVLARPLDLPKNLSIQFDLTWSTKPNFAFRFCAKNNKATTSSDQDAYELTFNSAGMQIRRYAIGKKSISLVTLNLKPHEIDQRRLNVELRVNREQGKITLLLDGVERGTYLDTFDSSEGKFIILNNRTSIQNALFLRNLVISEWSNGVEPRFRGKLEEVNADMLIDSVGNQRTGKLTTLRQNGPKKREVLLDTKHSDQPMRVPATKLSALVFAKQGELPPTPASTYRVELVGGGSINLESPKLENGKITTKHHILGSCTIDTSAVSRIVQLRP